MSARRATAWDDWLGRQRVVEDVITGGAVNALAATLDIPRAPAQRGEPLPCCWHWLYFQQPAPASRLGADGHALRGDFLPPVNLPRRMWAGGRLQFYRPLRIGDSLRRESTIADIACKRGASGELVFVRLDHRILCGEELVLEEQQDLVFREAPRGGTSQKHQRSPQPTPQWSRSLQPDPVLLFRYSALTFNAHRIHYDRDYAVEQEGYAGLVVQGPLAATLLLQQLQSELPLVRVQRFEFRSLRPLLDNAPLTLQGRRENDAVELWVLDHQGDLAMQAHVQVSEQR
tara:strand:- start:984 stop:1844 length:861 start_codon:yes stop_codon:yes gene_type:complete